MTIAFKNPIDELSVRLKKVDKKLAKEIKNYLPSWWDAELINSPSAVQQVLVGIAKFTNLNIRDVLGEDRELSFKNERMHCYKYAINKEDSELAAATAITKSLAYTISDAVKTDYSPFQSARIIRGNLINVGKPWVDFQSLVNYCWEKGVPVLYIPALPVSKKMDGIVVDINDRPVICLTKKHKHESELLFLLAHEMGHIFYDHLSSGQALIDKKINSQVDGLDDKEVEANTYAIELITGGEATKFHSGGTQLYPRQLAKLASEESKKYKIDPGHIVLNWGHTTQNWATAKSALNSLYPKLNWENFIKTILCENIDEDNTDEDQLEYLYKLMNIEG